jgi:predicted GIY-YIG superfamily endonuclease
MEDNTEIPRSISLKNTMSKNAMSIYMMSKNAMLEARALEVRALDSNALETNALETNALEANALETNALETNALETNALETNALETNALETVSPEKKYVVYLLVNTSNPCTYVGSTNNTIRRIRQHNGDLVGGAKYTKNNKNDGIWKFYGYIQNLEKRQALSIEKRIQIRSRKMTERRAIDRRLKAFNEILLEYTELGFTFTIL